MIQRAQSPRGFGEREYTRSLFKWMKRSKASDQEGNMQNVQWLIERLEQMPGDMRMRIPKEWNSFDFPGARACGNGEVDVPAAAF